jgi:indolepyruvate ferredoxin oxidoreductase alpha subunit
MLEPSDSKDSLEFAKAAYELSEAFDTPVLLKMCTRVAHSQSIVETSDRTETAQKEYVKNPQKYIMMPGFAKKRHPIVEERLLKIAEFSANSDLNRVEEGTDKSVGIITAGTCYQYVKEVAKDKYSVLKLGIVWPLSEKLIKDFASTVDKVIVIEELDGFIEEFCKNIGVECEGKNIFSNIDELSQNKVAKGLGIEYEAGNEVDAVIPNRPPVMCAGCPHRGLYYVLSKLKLNVIGDIGCYTLGAVAPLNAVDSVICMGASVSGVHGFNKANDGKSEGKTVAVIGDSTFMHSGLTGLVNISYNNSNSTVIILDNSITGMTGHQHNPTTGFNLKGDPASKVDLEGVCRAIGINSVRVVDPYNIAECEQVIKEELERNEPSVIISRRPCALLKYVKYKTPVVVSSDKCKSCKMCMKIGCPAISMVDGKAVIDSTLCTGCNVCTQLCKFGAMQEGK